MESRLICSMKATLCPCGCGKSAIACKSPSLSVNVFSKSLNSPEEQAEIIENVQIGSTFNMRMRGHLLFYGKDLTGYAKKTTVTPNTSHFLHLLSDYLYGKSDAGSVDSWEDCTHSFWDEFVSAYCPHTICLSQRENEASKFLFQLTKFANWMDTNSGTSLLSIINPCIKNNKSDVILCEKIINYLLKQHFPNILGKGWDYSQALDKIEAAYNSHADIEEGLFEVTGIIDKITLARNVRSQQGHSIQGLPTTLLKPGLLLHGEIGKQYRENKWNWIHTFGAFPPQSIKYLSIHIDTAAPGPYTDSEFRK
jgi:hypothetical protein